MLTDELGNFNLRARLMTSAYDFSLNHSERLPFCLSTAVHSFLIMLLGVGRFG